MENTAVETRFDKRTQNEKSAELLRRVPEIIVNTTMNLLIIGLSPMMAKELKDTDPELYWSTRGRIREFRVELEKIMQRMDEALKKD